MLVLSANNTGLAILLIIDEKSFIQRKNYGPNTEPCGTPCFICSHLNYTLLNFLSFIVVL